MMNKNASDHPNRLVTCPVCGAQMPRRFLAGHQKQHEPGAAVAAGAESADDKAAGAESADDKAAGAAVAAGVETAGDKAAPAGSAHAPKRDRAGTLLCPACGQFVLEADFSAHMADNHAAWCPLCSTLPTDLLDHLKRSHHVKPLQPSPGFGHGWRTQPRFVCLWCKKNISVWSYPRHAQPHGQREKPASK